jgi:ribosomal protein S18 acetylase RimI-like enzyme
MNLIYSEMPIQKDIEFLESELLGFNRGKIENYGYDRFIYKYLDKFDSITAGIDCQVGCGWLYIVSLWIEESDRRKGIGNALLSAAEQKAVEKGCHSAYLYTYSFQSPEFYEKNGYITFGKLENFCGDHEKLFLKKRLA